MKTKTTRTVNGTSQFCCGSTSHGHPTHLCTTYTTLTYLPEDGRRERRYHFCDHHPDLETHKAHSKNFLAQSDSAVRLMPKLVADAGRQDWLIVRIEDDMLYEVCVAALLDEKAHASATATDTTTGQVRSYYDHPDHGEYIVSGQLDDDEAAVTFELPPTLATKMHEQAEDKATETYGLPCMGCGRYGCDGTCQR